MDFTQIGIQAIERGFVPDALTRKAIRRMCRVRLNDIRNEVDESRAKFLETMRSGDIALVPDAANKQHYELPTEFFKAILGPRLKYSCCYFASENTTLVEAEEAALGVTCQRASIADGQRILDLGCGWGSLSLWMAEQYRHSSITAVSNSTSQRLFIENEAQSRGLTNLRVITCDMNTFSPDERSFDRVVSIEMFEHMRNYDRLLERIASWLHADGALFIHLFCHRNLSYEFETNGAANWMGRHFFSGGIMPSANLLRSYSRNLQVSEQYSWSGKHYQRTAEAWLANLDAQRDRVLPILARVYGNHEARRWFNRWRMFFMAVAELFGYAGGTEWFVAHYVLKSVTHGNLNHR